MYFMRRVLTGLFNWSSRSENLAGLGQLTRLIRRFSVEQQQVPKDLAELVTLNYLEAVPPAPTGKRFVIDRRKVEVRLEPTEINPNGKIAEPNPSLRCRIASNPDENPT
jgi:hypothetical protein